MKKWSPRKIHQTDHNIRKSTYIRESTRVVEKMSPRKIQERARNIRKSTQTRKTHVRERSITKNKRSRTHIRNVAVEKLSPRKSSKPRERSITQKTRSRTHMRNVEVEKLSPRKSLEPRKTHDRERSILAKFMKGLAIFAKARKLEKHTIANDR